MPVAPPVLVRMLMSPPAVRFEPAAVSLVCVLLLLLLVGPGAGYGSLYLSHLLSVLAVPFIVRRWLLSRSEWRFVAPTFMWAALLLVAATRQVRSNRYSTATM